jgi:uncharacterized protein
MIYTNKRYSEYLKEKYGERIHKISLDAGFSCPNKNGCIYCNNSSFSYAKNVNENYKILNLEEQIIRTIKFVKKRFLANKFILYFQTNTNTFAPINILKEKYDVIYKFPEIIGLNISTRPDCIDENILELIKSYTEKYEVWIEFGLQSIHDKTLDLINRGHKFEDFLNAVHLTRKISDKIKICAHLIVGLPNETRDMIMQSIDKMNELKIDGVKLHPMHIVKDTVLADMFLKQQNFDNSNSEKMKFEFFEFEKYIEILADILDKLDKNIIIHGFSGYCPKKILIEPYWLSIRDKVILGLEEYKK